MRILFSTRNFWFVRIFEPVIRMLGKRSTLTLFQDADHSFHVPARTGRKDPQVRAEMLDTFAAWVDAVI